jgi:hypothetical protein
MLQPDVRVRRNRGFVVSVAAAFWGAHAPSRVRFDASPKCLCFKESVGEGANRCTRGACAPQPVRVNTR